MAISVPALLFMGPTTCAVRLPVAEIVPRVLSALPPTVRLASPPLASEPSTLIRSPLVTMFSDPALSLPPVLSNCPTLALKPLLTLSVPPWLSKVGWLTLMLARLRVPPLLLMFALCSVIGPPA
ncbi:hypothetical protein D9M69_647380 [compost metagenome]